MADQVELHYVAGRHPNPPAPRTARGVPSPCCPWRGRCCTRRGAAALAEGRVGHRRDRRRPCHRARAGGHEPPLVVTVHDLAFLHRPEQFTRHGASLMTRSLTRSASAPTRDLFERGDDRATASMPGSPPIGCATFRWVSTSSRCDRGRHRSGPHAGIACPRSSCCSSGRWSRARTCPPGRGGRPGRHAARSSWSAWTGGAIGPTLARPTRCCSASSPTPTWRRCTRRPGLRLSERAGRVRTARARGDGAGHAGRHEPGHVDRGGGRWCRRARRSVRRRHRSPTGSGRAVAIGTGRRPHAGRDGPRDARGGNGRTRRSPSTVSWRHEHHENDGRRATVAVNLLWCVPGDVGGSEEYLVRQLLGLADQPAGLRADAATACRRSSTPIRNSPRCTRWSTARITGARPASARARREHLAGPAHAPGRLVHHGGGTIPTIGSGPIVLTIHDLQYLTLPAVPDRRQAALPRVGDPAVGPPCDGGRGAERVRAVRSSSSASATIPAASSSSPTVSSRDSARCARARRTPARLRARDRAGARVPGDHPPAQGPSVPARGDGAARGPIRTCGWCCSAGRARPHADVGGRSSSCGLGAARRAAGPCAGRRP